MYRDMDDPNFKANVFNSQIITQQTRNLQNCVRKDCQCFLQFAKGFDTQDGLIDSSSCRGGADTLSVLNIFVAL